MKVMSFVTAMRDYFGLREGADNAAFLQELKALTVSDKEWFRTNLPKVGYQLTA